MTLSYGRSYLAIPGPTVVPDRVLAAMHRASPNIYEGPLVEMVPGLIADLKALARTRGDLAIYIGNGHAAWEASLANILSPGDRVLVLASGAFGQGWAAIAERLGARVEVMDFGLQAPLDPAAVEARLAQDRAGNGAGEIVAVLAVHVDTSTGIRADIAALRAAMDRVGHGALLAVDCIASLGCERFEMDQWGVDVALAASQKGLMCPPGLAYVFFGERAAARRAQVGCTSPYWDWVPRAAPAHFYQYFAGTAPVHLLMGQREALDMIAEEGGAEAVWARHEKLARAVWAACAAWAQGGALAINAPEGARSHAVTALSLPAPEATRLRQWCEERAGVTLGIGLGMAPPDDPAWHGYFRLGHMGHVNAHMLMGALGAMEAGMRALGIAHGSGALEAAAEVVAEA